MSAESGTHFGREIADFALGQIASADLDTQRRISWLRDIVDRADRAMEAAARGRRIGGMSRVATAEWLQHARDGFGARLNEARAESRPDGPPR